MNTKKPSGQGNMEYALILLLIAVAAIMIMQITGVSVESVFCRVAGGLGAKNCGSSTICQDDFTDLSGSLVKSGTWTVSNGQLCNSGGGGMVYNKCSMGNGSLPTNDYTASLNVANLTAGNKGQRKAMAKLCTWLDIDWRDFPPPAPETIPQAIA